MRRKGNKLLIGILVAVAVALFVFVAVTGGVFLYNTIAAKVANTQKVEVTFHPANGYGATRAEMDAAVSVIENRLKEKKITNRSIKVEAIV